jgi:hypothetical protein
VHGRAHLDCQQPSFDDHNVRENQKVHGEGEVESGRKDEDKGKNEGEEPRTTG